MCTQQCMMAPLALISKMHWLVHVAMKLSLAAWEPCAIIKANHPSQAWIPLNCNLCNTPSDMRDPAFEALPVYEAWNDQTVPPMKMKWTALPVELISQDPNRSFVRLSQSSPGTPCFVLMLSLHMLSLCKASVQILKFASHTNFKSIYGLQTLKCETIVFQTQPA